MMGFVAAVAAVVVVDLVAAAVVAAVVVVTWQIRGKDEIKASIEHSARKFADMTVCHNMHNCDEEFVIEI
jgi:hypothetical protein